MGLSSTVAFPVLIMLEYAGGQPTRFVKGLGKNVSTGDGAAARIMGWAHELEESELKVGFSTRCAASERWRLPNGADWRHPAFSAYKLFYIDQILVEILSS
jgi:hypothetical protein